MLLLVSFASVANADLIGNLEAFRVVMTEDGKEKFLPADQARPADVVEYRLTYTNAGEKPVSNVSIVDPIPEGMQYVLSSATEPEVGQVEFSIDDGRTYHAWPIVIKVKDENGIEKEKKATPDMVTHVRWVIADTFEPESQVKLSYRTSVK
jgi:uncharacterized repeat protein (TIGR01451 family)